MPQPLSPPALTGDELALLTAAYAGDLAKVHSLVAKGANINVQSNEFYDMGMHRSVTPLMCAADQGRLEVVRWLLGQQASHSAETVLTKSEGGPGTQALHFAAAAGHEAVVATLLDAGADPNAQGKLGRTPLTWALGEGKLGCAALLLSRGASATTKSKHKEYEPPLVVLASAASNTTSMVARQGKLVPAAKDLWDQKETLFDLFRMLLAAGADPNTTGTRGKVPLHSLGRAIPDDIRLPIARMLLEAGANPDAIDKDGYSPLLIAVVCNSTGFARLLLELPVDVNRLSPRGTLVDVVENNIQTTRRDIAAARTDDIRQYFEEQLRELEAFLELLKSRGGKSKSQLALPAEAAEPEVRHIASDFLKLVNTGEAEWALLAVQAPFAAVSDAYLKFAKAKSRQENVSVRPAADGEEIPRLAAIIKVKESPWTIVLRTIFYVRIPDIKHVTNAAKELSKLLNTRALAYVGTEDTDNGYCELFEGGKKLAATDDDDDDDKSIALLTRENIALPACYPTKDAENSWLAVEAPSISMVERADLIPR